MSIEIATRFFKGPDAVRDRLVQGILSALKDHDKDVAHLDARCRFRAKGLASFEEVCADHTKMTPLHFSIASSHLHLAVDRVLKVRFGRGDMEWVNKHMEQHGAKVVAACGNPAPVEPDEFAPVYVIFRALQAIDPRFSQGARAGGTA